MRALHPLHLRKWSPSIQRKTWLHLQHRHRLQERILPRLWGRQGRRPNPEIVLQKSQRAHRESFGWRKENAFLFGGNCRSHRSLQQRKLQEGVGDPHRQSSWRDGLRRIERYRHRLWPILHHSGLHVSLEQRAD